MIELPDGGDAAFRADDLFAGTVAPVRLQALRPRRESPRLLVVVEGVAAEQPELVWALHEAARREGTVLAVALLDCAAREGRRSRALAALDAHVLRAVGLTGVHGRVRTALLDPVLFEALGATARGADLVVVRPTGTAVLRPAVPRPPARTVV